jgi:hypothetical protein
MSDLCTDRIYGSSRRNLLRVVEVPYDSKYGDQITVKYDHPQYVLLKKNTFRHIEIKLRSEINYNKNLERDGENIIEFQNGLVSVTLHFKKLTDRKIPDLIQSISTRNRLADYEFIDSVIPKIAIVNQKGKVVSLSCDPLYNLNCDPIEPIIIKMTNLVNEGEEENVKDQNNEQEGESEQNTNADETQSEIDDTNKMITIKKDDEQRRKREIIDGSIDLSDENSKEDYANRLLLNEFCKSTNSMIENELQKTKTINQASNGNQENPKKDTKLISDSLVSDTKETFLMKKFGSWEAVYYEPYSDATGVLVTLRRQIPYEWTYENIKDISWCMPNNIENLNVSKSRRILYDEEDKKKWLYEVYFSN